MGGTRDATSASISCPGLTLKRIARLWCERRPNRAPPRGSQEQEPILSFGSNANLSYNPLPLDKKYKRKNFKRFHYPFTQREVDWKLADLADRTNS
jgi:hypothetical protein